MTLTARINLANFDRALGRYDAADAGFRSVLDSWARTQETDHPEALGALANLGRIYRERGDPVRAEQLLRDADERWHRRMGATHPTGAIFRRNVGGVLADRGHYDEAGRLLHEALDRLRAGTARRTRRSPKRCTSWDNWRAGAATSPRLNRGWARRSRCAATPGRAALPDGEEPRGTGSGTTRRQRPGQRTATARRRGRQSATRAPREPSPRRLGDARSRAGAADSKERLTDSSGEPATVHGCRPVTCPDDHTSEGEGQRQQSRLGLVEPIVSNHSFGHNLHETWRGDAHEW